MSELTQYHAEVEATGIPNTEAAIEALEANPHVTEASEHPDFDRTVEVSVQGTATNIDVATAHMVGTVRGQLKHRDIEYGVDVHGDAVRVIISGEAKSTDAEQATNEGEV
jgi:hypothetical protein